MMQNKIHYMFIVKKMYLLTLHYQRVVAALASVFRSLVFWLIFFIYLDRLTRKILCLPLNFLASRPLISQTAERHSLKSVSVVGA